MRSLRGTADESKLQGRIDAWDGRGTTACETYTAQDTCAEQTLDFMARMVAMKSGNKRHLESLASELATLADHAQSVTKSKSPPTSWSRNTQDVNVAVTVIQAASSSIHDGVTRFNLVYNAAPGEAASESMAKEMGGFCQQMVSSLTLLSSVGASNAMLMYFSAGTRAVLNSVKDVVDALLDVSRHKYLNSLTGVVWQACTELQKAPKTNKLACRRQMMQWSVAMKDTIDEFQEAAQVAKASGDGKADTPEDLEAHRQEGKGLDEQLEKLSMNGTGKGRLVDLEEDYLGDDLDFADMDEDYSKVELRCVEASIDALRLVRRCLKAANESLNTLDSDQPSDQPVRDDACGAKSKPEGLFQRKLLWAQSLQGRLEDVHECAGEVAVLLYPPLSDKALSERVNELERSLMAFCDVFENIEGKPSHGGGEEPILRKLTGDRLSDLRAAVACL